MEKPPAKIRSNGAFVDTLAGVIVGLIVGAMIGAEVFHTTRSIILSAVIFAPLFALLYRRYGNSPWFEIVWSICDSLF